jgi:hypothetical protein
MSEKSALEREFLSFIVLGIRPVFVDFHWLVRHASTPHAEAFSHLTHNRELRDQSVTDVILTDRKPTPRRAIWRGGFKSPMRYW